MSRERPYYGLPDWMIRLALRLAPPGTSVYSRALVENWHREVGERQHKVDDVPAYPVAPIDGEQ